MTTANGHDRYVAVRRDVPEGASTPAEPVVSQQGACVVAKKDLYGLPRGAPHMGSLPNAGGRHEIGSSALAPFLFASMSVRLFQPRTGGRSLADRHRFFRQLVVPLTHRPIGCSGRGKSETQIVPPETHSPPKVHHSKPHRRSMRAVVEARSAVGAVGDLRVSRPVLRHAADAARVPDAAGSPAGSGTCQRRSREGRLVTMT